jgi:DNA polymerase
MTPDHAKASRDLLAFYLEAGVDAPVGDAVNNYLSPPAPTPTAVPRADAGRQDLSGNRSANPATNGGPVEYAAPPAPQPPAVPEAAVMAARDATRGAATLDELQAILDQFEGCSLKATASRLVFADGNPEARLMLVGEAPGRDEDLEGLPFVGRSGKLLDLMLKSIGLDRTQAYIANIVPWRPPGNRTPTPVETQICLPFIQRQIELANPDVLVTVGQPSTGALLGVQGIMKNRGCWFTYHTGTREIRAMPMLHPAYLLRSPIAKRLAWRDMLAIKKALGETSAH